ncbi:MAG: hypothetical protein KBD16_02455 [Candidatus Pacebacteria bacterium]|nr:hypothetical protein [Candidatus Paceibacterota bacterium]
MITNQSTRSFWEQIRPGWTVLWSGTFQEVTDVMEIIEIDRHVRWYVLRLQEMGGESISWIVARFVNLKGEFAGFDEVTEGTREDLLQEMPELFNQLESTTRLADHPFAQELVFTKREDGSSVRYLQPHPPLAGKVTMFPPLDVEGEALAFVAKYAIEKGAMAEDTELFVFEIGVPDDKGGLIRFLAGSPIKIDEVEFVPPST